MGFTPEYADVARTTVRCAFASDVGDWAADKWGPVPASNIYPSFPWMHFVDLVSIKALAYHAEDRYASMMEFVEDLRRATFTGMVPIGASVRRAHLGPTQVGTEVSAPSSTIVVEARVGVLSTKIRPTERRHFGDVVRLGAEADEEKSGHIADLKRRYGVLLGTQAIHRVLLKRLEQVRKNESLRARILETLPSKPSQGRDKRTFGEQRLGEYLRSPTKLPSLSAIGGWFSLKYMIEPDWLRAELRHNLRVQYSIGHQHLLAAGDLRNVIAHIAEYEHTGVDRIGEARPWLEARQIGAKWEMRVPERTTVWLEWVCRSILEGTDIPAPATLVCA